MATYTRVTDQFYSVQDAVGGGTTIAVELPLDPTEGNLVCVACIFYGGSGASSMTVQDGAANAYVVPAGSPSAWDANAGQIHLAYLLSAPANADKTITATFNETITVAAIWAREYHPDVAIAFDQYAEGTGTASTASDPDYLVDTPTATVTSTNELGFAACAFSASLDTCNSPWTKVSLDHLGVLCEDNLDLDANTAVSYTGIEGGTWSGAAMTFKDAGGGSSTTLKGTTTSRGMFRGMNRHVVSG